MTVKPTKRWYDAEVLYPKQHCQVLDVAVIKLLNFVPDQLSAISMYKSDSAITAGKDIFIIGYGMFSSNTNSVTEPTITRGNIATIGCVDNKPMLIQVFLDMSIIYCLLSKMMTLIDLE